MIYLFMFFKARLNTGTPPRLSFKSINTKGLEIQPGDSKIQFFSFVHEFQNFKPINKLVDCYITWTNKESHEVLMNNFDKLPEYEGNDGKGQGPRYCPSIDKKLKRFPDKTTHRIFLEPEGLNTDTIYPNGISAAFEESVQIEFLRCIKGLENVQMTQPGTIMNNLINEIF